LNDVWGEVPSTETTAIMGASGAGKTSLLNILAGRARTHGKIRIEADVRLQNYTVDPTSIKIRKSIAFVAQDDSLQITATPREAIRFSAKLRLPRSTTDSQLDKLTTRMLNELGLSSCADTIVGGPLIKGLSGGERKRASVGVELVVKPAMVFLDEPTSGLDSFSSVQVCQVLKKVANSGASVLFTIHQPSSEIFNSFDRLILLHKGRVLFQGPVKDVPLSFAACGYPVPINFNPADWVVNVAQKYAIPDLERAGFFQDDDREVMPPTIPLKGQNLLGEPLSNRLNSIMGKNDDDDDKTPGLWAQVKLLYRRELTYMYRFPLPLYARFGFTAFLSCLIGIIFYKVGDASQADPFNITSQFGALMILLMLAMLGTAQPALLFFPEERPIFLREYSTDHYSVMSYFVSRLLVEMMNTGVQILIMATLIYFMVSFNGSYWIFLGTTYALAMSGTAMAVMLGVLAEGNAKVAQQLLPLLFIPQLLFSGFFVSPSLMPSYLQWAQYVCVLTYAVRILIVEEFYECSDNPTENRNCQNLVENVRADPDQLLFYWSMLVIYFIVFRTLALFLLRRSATKFY
jgi:ABC-type multidrug transport system ATPase subunit